MRVFNAVPLIPGEFTIILVGSCYPRCSLVPSPLPPAPAWSFTLFCDGLSFQANSHVAGKEGLPSPQHMAQSPTYSRCFQMKHFTFPHASLLVASRYQVLKIDKGVGLLAGIHFCHWMQPLPVFLGLCLVIHTQVPSGVQYQESSEIPSYN